MGPTDGELEKILTERYGQGCMIVVIPGPQGAGCSCGAHTQNGADASFVMDLSITQYRERYEPGVSEGTIAEWCREGLFPDTIGVDGETIPGAYKAGRDWQITMEGIRERQRRAREKGLQERCSSVRTMPRALVVDAPAARELQHRPHQATPRARGRKQNAEPLAPRARQGAWKEAKRAS